ncbi:MAG: hypothetical protein HY887_10405, partial [Deltaproteobacteria bacterium]|nr:hypothetical protein [Deltaproteobacteria bacterium]
MGAAVNSALNTIESQIVQPSASLSGPAASYNKIIQLPKISGDSIQKSSALANQTVDIDSGGGYTKLNINGYADSYYVDLDGKTGSAADWLGEVVSLDTNQFSSLSDLKNKAINNKNIYNRVSVFGKDRAEAKGWVRTVGEFISTLTDLIFSGIFKDGVKIPATTDGVYLVRAYSGGGWGESSDGPAERDFLPQIPNGSGSANTRYALGLNIYGTAMDMATAVFDFKAVFGKNSECIVGMAIAGIDNVTTFYATYTYNGFEDFLDGPVNVGIATFIDGIKGCISGTAQDSINKSLAGYISRAVKTAVGEAVKVVTVTKWIDIAVATGETLERWSKLYFWMTPVESSFIVVGNPLANATADTAIAGGWYHTIALKNDGTVWTWGWNYYGQLGDGTTTDRLTPVQVSGLTNVTAIASVYDHTIALKNDGTVWTWGANWYGQLGDGTTTNKSAPVQVSGLTSVTAIAGGNKHTIALKNDGTVWAWGANWAGQLGDGTTI